VTFDDIQAHSRVEIKAEDGSDKTLTVEAWDANYDYDNNRCVSWSTFPDGNGPLITRANFIRVLT
jgi:hypothetical protein